MFNSSFYCKYIYSIRTLGKKCHFIFRKGFSAVGLGLLRVRFRVWIRVKVRVRVRTRVAVKVNGNVFK